MIKDLSRINPETKGLKGFIGNLGRDLEGGLVEKFDSGWGKVSVGYQECDPSHFILKWNYKGAQYNFAEAFSIRGNTENSKLVIERSPTKVDDKLSWIEPREALKEFRTAADIKDFVTGFLETKFGESTGRKGDGYIMYRTKLPEEYSLSCVNLS